MPQRLSYKDSCRALQAQQIIDSGEIPPMLERPPRHDDEVLGVSFFRTLLADAKLEDMTLPRTFFGRSEIRNTSFRGCDLSESTANWNDFTDADFEAADLSNSDFRGCVFLNVSFANATLTEADFRCCSFTNCDFGRAHTSRLKLTRAAGASLELSPEQERTIDWHTHDGEEPEGG